MFTILGFADFKTIPHPGRFSSYNYGSNRSARQEPRLKISGLVAGQPGKTEDYIDEGLKMAGWQSFQLAAAAIPKLLNDLEVLSACSGIFLSDCSLFLSSEETT